MIPVSVFFGPPPATSGISLVLEYSIRSSTEYSSRTVESSIRTALHI